MMVVSSALPGSVLPFKWEITALFASTPGVVFRIASASAFDLPASDCASVRSA